MTRERKLLEQLVKSWAQNHTSDFVVADYDTNDQAIANTSGYFTWVVREGHTNVDLMSLIDQLELFLDSRRKHKYADGLYCINCGDFSEYAEANQDDGSLICYACRHSPYV